VLERSAVGLYDLAVAPAHRGGGRGRALVQALLHWATEAGATSAYLQVRAQNTPALRLYESMGFTTAYGYHYRVPG
jgi:ribosomal protein S18 acetylase RimI-like enzyme